MLLASLFHFFFHDFFAHCFNSAASNALWETSLSTSPFATRHPEKPFCFAAASLPFILPASLLRIVQRDRERALRKQSLAETPFSKWVNRAEPRFQGCTLTSGSLLARLAVKNSTTSWTQNRNKKPTIPAFKCQRPYHAEHTSSRPITEVKQR